MKKLLVLMLLVAEWIKANAVPTYYEDTTYLGQTFLTVYGVQINDSYKPQYFANRSRCECRSICFVLNCFVVSVSESSGGIDCRIIAGVGHTPVPLMMFEKKQGGIVYAQKNFGDYFFANGYFYIYNPSGGNNNCAARKAFCASNYADVGRLSILKTLKELNGYRNFIIMNGILSIKCLNLEVNNAAQWIWGGGTLYSDTEVGHQYHLQSATTGRFTTVHCYSNSFTFATSTSDSGPSLVCQLDPFQLYNE